MRGFPHGPERFCRSTTRPKIRLPSRPFLTRLSLAQTDDTLQSQPRLAYLQQESRYAMLDGGISGIGTDAHSDHSVGIGGEHSAPEVASSSSLPNTNLPHLQVLNSELSKNVDQKACLTWADGI